ncbi:hypothetical protein COO91_04160 [Nostoc flagelliforme CCNUN1]|uniref:Uncharacterized protein n=1 Tax=Nostoc flagelliforme CCNUN1 TaxID=2038116 RepID=A0A2K8STS8_9NOSO|nr:hypothetical protein COO91_04160 [Nostoc flagelliforme CCNUN1]
MIIKGLAKNKLSQIIYSRGAMPCAPTFAKPYERCGFSPLNILYL